MHNGSRDLCFKIVAFLPLLLAQNVWGYASSGNYFEVTLSQANYQGQPQIVEQDNKYSAVTPSFQYLSQRGSGEGKYSVFYSNGLAVIPMSDGVEKGLAVPEMYYSFTNENHTQSYAFGRKIETWSELDKYWNLGLWQPQVRWDGANPFQQGLTGIFSNFELSKDVQAHFFISGVFLPDQQPDYQEKNGRIISTNRWFRAPVFSARLVQSSGDIYYDVEEPSAAKVIEQFSAAAMLNIGNPESGANLRLSVADKPMNQFHIGVDINETYDTLYGGFQAHIHPFSIRQQIYTGELEYKGADASVIFSTNWEKFQNPNLPSNWFQTELADSHYEGAVFSYALNKIGLKRSTVSLSYVKRTLMGEKYTSTLIKGDVEASTQRFQFSEMGALHFDANLIRTYRHELDVNFKYIYSIADKGEWIQAGASYKQDRRWIWALAGDVLGVPAGTPAGTSFISKFRGNDRIIGSMTYVF